jgi:cell wall assembly regulator SMI1
MPSILIDALGPRPEKEALMLKRKLIKSSKKISDDDIKKVEKLIKLSFPSDLKNFYLKYNGGEVEGGRKIYLGKNGMEYEVKNFLPIGHPRFEADALLEDSYVFFVKEKKLIPRNFIPFAMDSGGFRYCINADDGKVYFSNLDKEGKPADCMELVAPSIDEFINTLITEKQAFK